MATISRLFAAVFFAAVAFFAAEAVKFVLSEGIRFGPFSEICAGIGFTCGWVMTHRTLGKGYRNAINVGVRIAAVITLWSMLYGSIALMVRKAFRKMYHTPLDAVVDIFRLIFDNAPVLLTPTVIVTLTAGGIFGGLIAEWVQRRWD